MSIIGFTGTRNGMTEPQKQTLSTLLREMRPQAFHHGDCVGADAEAAGIADALGVRIICHPPTNTTDRAYTRADEAREPKSYFERNRDIVHESDVLIGASYGPTEHPTGGTWYTIRYAVKYGVYSHCYKIIVIWPDGTTEER